MQLGTDKVIGHIDGAIGHLTLNQPEKHNAMSYEMWSALIIAMAGFAADDGVRVVILRGEGGRAFSAGADISEFETRRHTPEAVAEYDGNTRKAIDALAEIDKPTIAHIEGYCVGGGFELAMYCDLRFASEASSFGIPAAKLGLGYGFEDVRALVQTVGPAAAKEILFTGRRFDGQQALQMGLINKVLPADELAAYVSETADMIAANAPLTHKASKRTVHEVLKDAEMRDEALCHRLVEQCFASTDYVEGRTAFMEKRRPRFRGK
ncbi:MAG: enoyl-CoA hydratase [Gammaproteobacteria bacterium]